jgi:hypothetical protein
VKTGVCIPSEPKIPAVFVFGKPSHRATNVGMMWTRFSMNAFYPD